MQRNDVDFTYILIANECMRFGTRKPNRTGVDTISQFNVNYSVDLSGGFPLLTTKTISWKNIVVELLWFLSGDTHIDLLKKHNCKFWDAWADDNNEVPSAYGNFWRNFPTPSGTNDQLKWIEATLKNNPMSRRMVCSAWAPGNAQTSALPPCHSLFVFNTQIDVNGEPRLCCHLTQRSADLALGVPYNLASYALLTQLFAKFTNMQLGVFGHTMVDTHIYTCNEDGSMPNRPDGTPYSIYADHVPGLKEQSRRRGNWLPNVVIDDNVRSLDDIRDILELDTDQILEIFKLEHYHPDPAIRFEPAI